MSNKAPLDQKEFDGLLDWLSSDRDEAGAKYESIRLGLVRYFRFKGCSNEEDLADETINRVARKLPQLDLSSDNKPITYFYGFAAKIFLEEIKKRRKEAEFKTDFLPHNPNNLSEEEVGQIDCLEECLRKIEPNEREVVINYYLKDKSDKSDFRRQIAESLNISTNTLHVKMYRLRNKLRICIERCSIKKKV